MARLDHPKGVGYIGKQTVPTLIDIHDLESIVVGAYTKYDFHVLSVHVVDCRQITWKVVLLLFRIKLPSGKWSIPRLSLRKYHYNKYGWKCKYVFNVNSLKEAKQIHNLLVTYFPTINER